MGVELLNDECETARDLEEHCVTEGPVWLLWDLLLRMPRRHFQLQKRVHVIRVPRDRSQTPHSSECDIQIEISELKCKMEENREGTRGRVCPNQAMHAVGWGGLGWVGLG